MSARSGQEATETPVGPCPSWCTLPAGHGWDALVGDQEPARLHQGPDFGSAVSVAAEERAAIVGYLEPSRVLVCAEEDRSDVEADELARHLQAAAAWVREDMTRRGWWRSASNPPCRPWCERNHEAGEFGRYGAITCTAAVIFERGAVFLAQTSAADERVTAEAGRVDVDEPTLELTFDGAEHGDDVFSVDGAEQAALTLLEAVRRARTLAAS